METPLERHPDGPMTQLAVDPSRRTLGTSEITCAPIAYGLWRFAGTDVKTARTKVEAALDLG